MGYDPALRPYQYQPDEAKKLLQQAGYKGEKITFTELTSVVDEKERDQRLRKINQELYDEYWSVPIGIVNLVYAAGPKVADWQPTNGALDDYAFETLAPKR